MVLSNERYTVTVTTEFMPSLEEYTVINEWDKLDLQDCYSARLIEIEPDIGQPRLIAAADFAISGAEPCAVLENDILTVVQCSDILRIDLRTGLLVQRVICDNTGGLEQIYAIDNGYIIKGESDIFRYDFAWNRIWHFCARDIFASPINDVCFWMDNNVIHCRDWLGWHYMLDLNGKLIHEEPEKSPPS